MAQAVTYAANCKFEVYIIPSCFLEGV